MSFDDDFLGKIFPTRVGGATGAANERQMLDKTGAGGFHKTYRTLQDGSQVRCETKNGMPQFIRSGGTTPVQAEGCALEMDTGIIDLISISDYSPQLQDPGLVYHTDYVAGQVGGLTEAVGTGKIKYPKYTGPVIPSGSVAKAFSSDYKGATSFTNRKKIAARIPPSLFTGRMRLYVQSLYGGTWDELTLADISWGVGRPILSVNTLAREENGLQPTYIGSGTGLYFDPATKRHYSIVLTTSTAYISPLISTPCAEKYRELLTSSPISSADEERIEAYILSQSVPAHEKAQVLTFEETPNEAMGYGWHFNFDGTACDIVSVIEVNVDGVWGFETTHYRLDFSFNGSSFSVARSIVRGPEIWTVPKNINVIAYPDWFIRNLVKAGNTPSGGATMAQSGAVYAFYQKNKLNVVEFNSTYTPAENVRISDPQRFGGLYYNSVPAGWILPGENGYTRTEQKTQISEVHFQCDGVVIGGQSYTSQTYDVSLEWVEEEILAGTDLTSRIPTDPYRMYWSQPIGNPTYTVSYNAIGSADVSITGWEYSSPVLITTITTNPTYNVWNRSDKIYTENRTAKTLIVVPFFDAEAIFLHDQPEFTKTGYENTYVVKQYDTSIQALDDSTNCFVGNTTVNGNVYERNTFFTPLSGEGILFQVLDHVDYNDANPEKNDVSLICAHGIFSGNVISKDSFFSTLDSVAQFYRTVCSVNGVVYAPDNGVVKGVSNVPNIYSIVGWA